MITCVDSFYYYLIKCVIATHCNLFWALLKAYERNRTLKEVAVVAHASHTFPYATSETS